MEGYIITYNGKQYKITVPKGARLLTVIENWAVKKFGTFKRELYTARVEKES